MERALLYKEWKKMKWAYIGVLAVGILLLTYVFMSIGRSFRVTGAGHIWDFIVNRNQVYFSDLKYYALAAGITLGVAQFVPEMIQKRIKLSLHLPMTERKIIVWMLGAGQLLLLSILAIHLLALLVFSYLYFPAEILYATLQTILPWYLAGLIAYSFIGMICLEPTWKRRVINLILMVGTIKLCFITTYQGAYSHLICALLLLTLLILPFTFLSVKRFKEGEQD